MKKNNFENIIRYVFSTLGIMLGLTMVALSGYYLYTVFAQHNYKEIQTNYTVDSGIDYKVYIKDNDYIKDKYMGMDLNYVNKLVSDIKSTLAFNYTNEEETPLTYSYDIEGRLTGTYNDSTGNVSDADVWAETYKIKTFEETELKGNSLNIEENVDTDFEALIARTMGFQEDLSLPIVANYELKMTINLTFDIDGEKVQKTHYVGMTIPVNTTVFTITKMNEDNVSIQVDKKVVKDEINKIYLILAVSAIALSLIVVITLLKYGYTEVKTEGEEELEEIFEVYGDRIVTVGNIAQTKDTDFVDLLSFDEMIELVNELNLPILCWHDEKNGTVWFCAIKGEVTYRYTVKE